ncbi:MucR family transcriptional regulator [Labrys monachus]|uniref:Transcriptional regulator n=1 Tax=Labrys monachus TaxID=217067 RepID=A0ABU0FFS5_9HYPH|nr:MucR family transcriptional regulator [Labrys monachus]MDQ0392895.1 putative transcriptional regulator [Labrys monachus]
MDDVAVDITAGIVTAYVSHNNVASIELPKLIADVHAALRKLAKGEAPEQPPEARPVPAVPIRKSITPDYLVSLEDGRKYKSLRRHLSVQYNMTPDDYRAKWNLPADYPMVAPNYSKSRSDLARRIGFGQTLRKRPAPKMAAVQQ